MKKIKKEVTMKKLLIAGIATALLVAVIGMPLFSQEAEAESSAVITESAYYTITVPASGEEEYWLPFRWEREIPKEYKISKVLVWETSNPNGKVEVSRNVKNAFGWFRFTEAENAFGKYAILFENQKHDRDRNISIEIIVTKSLTVIVENPYYAIIVPKSGREEYWRPFKWETQIPKEYKINKVLVWETSNPNGKVEVSRNVKNAFGWFRFTEAENAFGKYAILFENEKHDRDRRISIEIILK